MNDTKNPQTITDSSGYKVFSDGSAGEAHVFAHEMLDQGREAEGWEWLGEWLATHEGSGSEWVHLQWHMAVFEIAVGRVREAHERYLAQIEPAVRSGEALTDAPSLLWRLALADPSLELDWQPVVDAARARLHRGKEAYVELHNVLALAGSSDLATLTEWLDDESRSASSQREVLLPVAWGLRCFASHDYSAAAQLIDTKAGEIRHLGGSRAQNDLFSDIAEAARGFGHMAA